MAKIGRFKMDIIKSPVIMFSISFLYFIISHVTCEPEGNIFSSIAHMEPLVDIEQRLVEVAREYIEQEKKKLSDLAPFAKSVEEAMELSKNNPEKYLGNPINCYLIIKRFTSGWKELSSKLVLDESKSQDIRDILRANEIYMPTYDIDMVGATSAIIRLQDTYNITAREVSDGVIKGLIPSPHQLTAEDCVNIAEIAHITRRYVRMKEWLDEGERLINDPTLSHRHGNTTTMLINEFLAWAYYLSNNISEALRYTELVLKEDPTKKEVLENKEVYSWYVSRNVPCTMPETTYMESAEKVMGIMQNSPYIKACKDRNPKRVKVKDESSLVSFYKQDKPRLILKPLRVSRLHDNPEVYMLYDVLKEKDMEKLRRIAIPRLKVAEVMDPENDSRIMANYRVSKSMFLQPFYPADHRISSRLNLRFEDITDLDMSASEELQLNNYGLGGQYEFHHDYGERGTEIEASPNGNRIATVLCYLSNVERGGETVFTEIGLSVLPKMGDALFWYNLHRNGTGVFNSKHASCPVLSGSKWVANKWVRMRGNEFSRKCSLNRFE